MMAPPHIVWFKRDLRLQDHAPLWNAAAEGAPVIPLYIVEPGYWAQPFASQRHWAFIHDCLSDLNHGLHRLGQPLVIRVGEACEVVKSLHQELGVSTLWAHEETADLWTYERDKKMRRMCRERGIAVREYPSNGVVRRLDSRDNWSAIRNRRMAEGLIAKPEQLTAAPKVQSAPLPAKDHPMFGPPLPGLAQKGGRRAAIEELRSFLEERSANYLRHISAPGLSEHSCSRLSAHLAWGTLSAREVVQALKRRKDQLSPLDKPRFGRNLSAFGARLAWRCHFIQKLEDQPSLETSCMHPAFEGLRESEHSETRFEAWKTGQTGVPFIDACMRSLIHRGWITFRMRAMLVSFASYQLWLDWRKTAPYLAGLFTDYEPGIHYSQFQMQSGVTGINAIRVYNPVKQGLDQDPDGRFTATWVPELRSLRGPQIHTPWQLTSTLFEPLQTQQGSPYPAPIVHLENAARQAKERIAAVRKSAAFGSAQSAVYQKHGSRKRRSKAKQAPDQKDQLDLF